VEWQERNRQDTEVASKTPRITRHGEQAPDFTDWKTGHELHELARNFRLLAATTPAIALNS
jgi:hypothetical protein